RHTRFSRDWSSDVCSSDLPAAAEEDAGAVTPGTPLVALADDLHLASASSLVVPDPELEPTGSNGIAIAPQNTVNGNALLLINPHTDRKSTRLNSSHVKISYAVFCLKKKKIESKTYELIIRLI